MCVRQFFFLFTEYTAFISEKIVNFASKTSRMCFYNISRLPVLNVLFYIVVNI